MRIQRRNLSVFLVILLLGSLLTMSVSASDSSSDALMPADDLTVVPPLYAEISGQCEEMESTGESAEATPSASEEKDPQEPEEKAPVGAELNYAETPEVSPAEEPVQTDGATQVSSVTIWDGEKDGCVPIKLEYTEYYSKAFEVLDYINEVRAGYGLYPLKMDAALMEGSMIRAGENTVWWEHRRANGELFQTTCSIAMVEIIAKVYPTPKQAVNGWLNSSSHRSVVLTDYYTHIGVGCVYIDGNWFWTAHGSTKYYELASESDYTDRKVTKTVYMTPSYMSGLFRISVSGTLDGMYPGDTAQIKARYYSSTYSYGFDLPVSGLTMYSTDLSVCKVDENGLITATGPGTASVVAYYPNYEAEAKVYAVTGLGSTTVSVTAPAALGTVTARIYPSTMSEDSIRADMLKTTSSSALYTGTAGVLGNEVPITFRGLPYGEYKLAVHAKGGFVILVDDLSVDAFYTTMSYPMWLYGDVDYNGSIDSVDVLETFNYSLGRPGILDSTPNIKQDAMRRLAADVNRDNAITIRDVTQILRRANGLASCFSTIP